LGTPWISYYIAVKNYNHQNACKDLVKKSGRLIMKSWLGEHNVYENYDSIEDV
jgi:hypothetical protein